MKTLSPTERVRSAGNVRRWTVLIAVASISCLPVLSALAEQPDHNNKGGGNKAPSSHQSSSHGGGVSRTPVHQGGNHVVSEPKSTSSHQGAYHASTNTTAVSHQNTVSHHDVVSRQHAGSHHTSTSHNASTKTATSHRTESRSSVAAKTEHTHVSGAQARNTSTELKKGASANSRTSLYERNNASREARNHQTANTQE